MCWKCSKYIQSVESGMYDRDVLFCFVLFCFVVNSRQYDIVYDSQRVKSVQSIYNVCYQGFKVTTKTLAKVKV